MSFTQNTVNQQKRQTVVPDTSSLNAGAYGYPVLTSSQLEPSQQMFNMTQSQGTGLPNLGAQRKGDSVVAYRSTTKIAIGIKFIL